MSDMPTVLRGGDEPQPQDEDLQPAPEKEGDHSKPEDWMLPARMGGATWDEIGDHVSGASDQALQDGHKPEDVDRYLGYTNNGVAQDKMLDSHAAAQPTGDKVDLGTPTMRDDYARALTENGVKDKHDFADTYATAALRAQFGDGNDLPQEERDKKHRQAAAAADGLAQTLPDRHDFVDAAASITDNPEDAERVRKQLIEEWRKTGKSPYQLAREDRTALNRHDPVDDPGFVLRTALYTGKAVADAWSGIAGLPNLGARAGDQVLEMLGADGGAGWVTRNTDWGLDLGKGFENGVNILDKLLGGSGKVDLSPHNTVVEHIADVAANIMALGPAGLGLKAASTVAGYTELMKGYNAARPVDRQSPLEQLGINLLAGLASHVAVGGAIKHWSPKEDGEAVRELTPQEYTHNELNHAEAREMAADPNFMQRLMADESGRLDLSGQGGDKATRPTYSLKEAELKEGEEAPKPGESKRMELWRSDNTEAPAGSMRVSFPEEAGGKTAFIDSMTAGKIGESQPVGPRDIRKLATQFFDLHPDVDRIEGWRVSGARQRAGTEGLMSITRDQIEKTKPADVRDLAEGYHTANVMHGILGHLGAVLQDEGGALELGNLPRLWGKSTSEQRLTDLSNRGREVFGKAFRAANGSARQDVRVLARQLEDSKAFQYANKHMEEAQNAIDLGGGGFRSTQLGQMWAMLHKQIPLDPNHPMEPALRLIMDTQDRMHQEAVQWKLDGLATSMPDYQRGYMKGMWENPNARWEEGARLEASPFGNQQYLRDKTYQNIFQGIAAGEKPKYLNPFENFLETVKNHEKQRMQYEMIRTLQDAFPGVPVGPQTTPPDGMMRLHGTGGDSGVAPSYAPKGFADMWNRLHDNGVLSDPFQEKFFNRLQYAVGMLNSLKLIWPMFHLRTIALGTFSDGMSKTLEELGGVAKGIYKGEYDIAAKQAQRALWSFASGVAFPLKAGDQLFRYGRNGMKEYETASQTEFSRALVDEGFSFGRGTFEYTGRDPSLHISAQMNWHPEDSHMQNVANLAKVAMKTQWEKLKADFGVGTDESLARRGVMSFLRGGDHILTEAERIATTASHGAFQYLIPRLQLGAIYERQVSWRERNPTASYDELRAYTRKLIMDQENRKGELNMVNVFWPKALKQTANATLLSVGWKYGTYRGLMQAAGWDPDQGQWKHPFSNPVAMMSVASTAAAWMTFNAAWQYIYTGTLPTDTGDYKDLLLFRTGGVGKRLGDTVPARGLLPGEPKEIYDLAHVLFTGMGNPSLLPSAMVEYGMAATNPLWQMLLGITRDEDGVGHHIGQYPGGWGRFFQESFLPIMTQAVKQNRVDSNIPNWEQQWFGTREAASWAENPTGWVKTKHDEEVKWMKEELKRARKEAAMYQNSEWLQEYIKEQEAQMQALGIGASSGSARALGIDRGYNPKRDLGLGAKRGPKTR